MVFFSGWCQRQINFKWGNLCYLVSRIIITVAVCVSMAGVGDKERHLAGGTGFLAISSITLLDLSPILNGMTAPVVFF